MLSPLPSAKPLLSRAPLSTAVCLLLSSPEPLHSLSLPEGSQNQTAGGGGGLTQATAMI
jgi:hypothetical protein